MAAGWPSFSILVFARYNLNNQMKYWRKQTTLDDFRCNKKKELMNTLKTKGELGEVEGQESRGWGCLEGWEGGEETAENLSYGKRWEEREGIGGWRREANPIANARIKQSYVQRERLGRTNGRMEGNRKGEKMKVRTTERSQYYIAYYYITSIHPYHTQCSVINTRAILVRIRFWIN